MTTFALLLLLSSMAFQQLLVLSMPVNLYLMRIVTNADCNEDDADSNEDDADSNEDDSDVYFSSDEESYTVIPIILCQIYYTHLIQ